MAYRRAQLSFARFALLVLLLICFVPFAFGQAGRGSISGTVTDTQGAVVSGAQVTLASAATGVTQRTVSSSAGLYAFISLNPGQYKVTVSSSGFANAVQDKIRVDVDQTTTVDISLRVGAATETVTVSEGVALVEATNSTVGSLIGAEQINRVPLISRNVFDLVQLSAGVNAVNGSPNSSDSMQSVQNISVGRPGVDVSADTINGSLVGSVYYMLDGSPIGVAENNSAAIIPAMNIPEDGVDEVRVETQNTPASYQSGGAGVISLVSKSGTNQLHGDIFGVFRPNALSSNDYFNKQFQLQNDLSNTPPTFHRYQEGAAIGGAIKRDKLFFFGDYEDTQQQQFEGIKTYTVPTSAEATGDFSAMSFTIYDPTLPDNADGTRQAFPGNKIPNPNPIGLLYLSKMPKCNTPSPATCDSATTDVSPNFSMPGLDPFNSHRFDVRVDWNASDKQRIFARFSYDKLIFSTANVFPSGWDEDYAQNTTNGRNILVADDLSLNATTALNLRYSFTRHHENQGGPASYSSVDITSLGFPSSLASQQVYKQLPFIFFDDVGGGVGGTADSNVFQYASENSDANATVTKTWGKHEFSTGFEWMKRFLNVGQPYAPAGAYDFAVSGTDKNSANPDGSGSDFASLLAGMGSAGDFTSDVFAAESNPYYAAFFEDTYHPTRKLTITAGVRWDIFGGRTERHNRQEYFDPTAAGSANGVSYTGAEIFVSSKNRSPFSANMHDLGPRLGFTWQPMPHLVARGGGGFYFGPSSHNVVSATVNTDGFSASSGWNLCADTDGNQVFYNTSTCSLTPGAPAQAPDNFTGPYSFSDPYPNGLVPVFTTPPAGLANNLGVALNTVLRSQRTPTTYNFNFGLEYELPHQVVVSAAYVGSRGLFLPFGAVDLDTLDLATIAKYGDSLCVLPDPSCMVPNQWEAIQPSTSPFYQQSVVPQYVALEQYPQFSTGLGSGVSIHAYPGGDSEYSSLQTKVQKRLTGHFTTLATFTWGKLMTNDGNPPLGFVGSHNGGVQDWRNLQYEHAIAPQDVKYAFTGDVSYDLPVGKGRLVDLHGAANVLLGGWTANGIVYLGTGVPINAPGSGTAFSPFNQRADMVCNPAKGAPHTVDAWFNIGCFVQPGTESGGQPNLYIPGNAPAYLDNVRTRGARDLDISLNKTVAFSDKKALRFDISGYNMTNYAQYGYPAVNSVVGVVEQGEPFGTIYNNVNSPRQFQFGARFTF